MPPSALFLSPHLDDVAFSCGGVAARLARAGWQVTMATVFTRSLQPTAGFALACQTDKGLGPDVDYMALRRAEDRVAADFMGVQPLWLDLPEAPHRGYTSAAELFTAPHAADDILPAIRAVLAPLFNAQPDLVFTPQTLGRHVDHVQLVRAILDDHPVERFIWYRDTPYAIRDPHAAPADALAGLEEQIIPIAPTLSCKQDAACAYASQIGFQFGGAVATRQALSDFAHAQGHGQPAEKLLVADPSQLAFLA